MEAGIRHVIAGHNAIDPIMKTEQAAAQAARRAFLNKAQRTAIEEVLTSADRIHGIQGLAGTGKTTVLASIRECAEATGYKVEGFAPTVRAADQLRQEGIEATTMQSFLAHQQQDASARASRHSLYAGRVEPCQHKTDAGIP